MYRMRRWSVRHAASLARVYAAFENALCALAPALEWLGHARVEPAFAAVERGVKGLLFDCRMCGRCMLKSTGMSCPMNCPKQLTNGPCGGVRIDGRCEVRPEMVCVWVDAFDGAGRIPGGLDAIRRLQPPVDRRLQGTSAWLRFLREERGSGA